MSDERALPEAEGNDERVPDKVTGADSALPVEPDAREDNDDFLQYPVVSFPGGLTQRMVPIDREVFDWFRSQGPDFEFRINEVLKRHIGIWKEPQP